MFTAEETLQIAKRYLREGQLDAARHLFRQVLELQPERADAFHFLGDIALQTGELSQARECFQKAAERNPDCAVYWNNLGCTYLQIGNSREAAAAFEQALRARPDYPAAYYNLGMAYHQLGELGQALVCYEQAIRLNPSSAAAYLSQGKTFVAQGDPEAAAASFEHVCRLQPHNADASYFLGLALEKMGNLEQAAEAYRQALALRPTFAVAANSLGKVLEEQGLFDDAVDHYRQAMHFQPDFAWSYYNLSYLVAAQRYDFTPTELRQLEALAAAGQGSLKEQSVLCFALAAVRDRQAHYDEAFALYRRGNELMMQELRAHNRGFDPEKHRARVDHIIATFDAAYFRKVESWGRDTNLPVFVLGVPRSGTTLVEQILSSHPAVYGAGELPDDMPRMMRALGNREANGDPGAHRALPSKAVARDVAADYLARLERLGAGARRVTVKTLDNHLYLGVLATLFPGARVIYCQRDPLDVGVSCYCQSFQEFPFSWSLEDIGFYYRQYERLMAHWRRVLPVAILDVCYEVLIAHPEATSRKMLDFCGLNWHERCLAFHKNPRAVRTASTVQVRQPLSSKSIGRWKKYEAFLAPLLQALRMPAGGQQTVRERSGFLPKFPVYSLMQKR